MILFHDISRWQNNYNMAADPNPAIAIKMSGGDDGLYYDSQATNNYNHAVTTGKVPIGYHFAGAKDPLAEADFFVRSMSPLAENDVLAIDWEVSHPDPVGWCTQFVNRVHDKTGLWCWIYLNRSTKKAHDWSPVTNNCALWIAAPDVSFDADISGIGVYMAQQGPIVNGIDTDAFFGTIEQLKEYGYHAPVAPVAPVEAPVTVPAPEPVIVPPVVPEPVLPAPEIVVVPVEPPKQTLLEWLKVIISKVVSWLATWKKG